MGYTLNGMVLSKKEYFSKKRNEQVYQLDMYDGQTVVAVSNVPNEIWGSVKDGETLAFKCKVCAFADNGRARLFVSFISLV